MDLLSLAILCGPLVDPAMTLRIIDRESAGQPFAIHDNSERRSYSPADAGSALKLAWVLISQGHRIDVGLMQVNVGAWLSEDTLPLEKVFDPCANIRLGTTILSADFARALGASRDVHGALPVALSLYNSGSATRSLSYAHSILRGRTTAVGKLHSAMNTAERARTAGVEFSR